MERPREWKLRPGWKGAVNGMENGRKKIWICLLTVVLAAVVIGILWYLSVPQEQNGEGFLIRTSRQEEYTASVQPGCADSSSEEGYDVL